MLLNVFDFYDLDYYSEGDLYFFWVCKLREFDIVF